MPTPPSVFVAVCPPSSPLTAFLAQAGPRLGGAWACERVTTLADAVKRAAQGGVQAVLLDGGAPEALGPDPIRRLRAQVPAVPVVMITPSFREDHDGAWLQQGAQDVISLEELREEPARLDRALRHALARQRADQHTLHLASFPEYHPYPVIELDLAGAVTYLNAAARARWPELAAGATQHAALDGAQEAGTALQHSNQPVVTRELAVGDRMFEQHLWLTAETHQLRAELIDITQRKQTEHLKDEFLSTVSHELRTPLATIKEFIGIVSDQLAGPVSPPQQEYLMIIKTNIARLERMINDLLDMAKIEAGSVFLAKEFVRVAPLLSHVLESLRPLAHTKQIELSSDAPEGVQTVFADADKITQVFINLVGNAIKFTPGPGRVVISVEDLENELTFHVADTGIGIEPENLPRLFEKFQQFHQVRGETGSKGTGLGLAICKRFVELHGGKIWAESNVGPGTTFSFTLPKYNVEEVLTDYLRSGLAQAKRHQRAFSILGVAIDEFDALKKRVGVEGTGQLLKAVELDVKQTVRRRAGDVVVRWQHGELIVIMADVDRAGCRIIADRVRSAISGRTYDIGSATCQVGVRVTSATYPEDAMDPEGLLRLVEERLGHAAGPAPRLLVVDDEPKARQMLKEMLELHGLEVLTAASGPEALEELKVQAVDLILLDVLMPVMDGYQLYHLLKEHPRTTHVPIIMVTGGGDRPDRALGLEAPTYNYVTKPVRVDELLQKIRVALSATPPPT